MIVRGHPHLDRQSDLTQALEEFKTVEMQPFLMIAVGSLPSARLAICSNSRTCEGDASVAAGTTIAAANATPPANDEIARLPRIETLESLCPPTAPL